LYTGDLVEIDHAKKEVRRVSIPRPNWGLINVVVLPGGKYLLPDSGNNRVVEVDASGKVTWQVTVPAPTCVAVLPGGNFLVGSHRNNTVCEVDRKGKVLWSERCEGQVFRVRVR
jgi:DNA-binding beta-propeller fold protein YncE